MIETKKMINEATGSVYCSTFNININQQGKTAEKK